MLNMLPLVTGKQMTPIERAIIEAGGQTSLAEAIGVSPSFINQLAKGDRPVPPARCRAVEQATNGKVTCAELRPDVFGTVAA